VAAVDIIVARGEAGWGDALWKR